MNNHIPLLIKPYLRGMRYNKPARVPYYLELDYVKELMDVENPTVSAFIDFSKVSNIETLNRAFNLEYLFQKLNLGS